jgi:hypothetical protein
MRRTHSLNLFEDKTKLTPERLERMREKYNKPVQSRTEILILMLERRYASRNCFEIENSECVNNGNYQIVEGRREPLMDAGFNSHWNPMIETFMEECE